ncbi:SDR family oxidoreductase, partial [Litorivivens sp.]
PGYFETELNSDFFQTDKGKSYLNRIPPQRLGQLDELSGPLLLLASEAGSFMTGVALPVDGGHLLQSL